MLPLRSICRPTQPRRSLPISKHGCTAAEAASRRCCAPLRIPLCLAATCGSTPVATCGSTPFSHRAKLGADSRRSFWPGRQIPWRTFLPKHAAACLFARGRKEISRKKCYGARLCPATPCRSALLLGLVARCCLAHLGLNVCRSI